jgi:dCMP deaminase
MNDKYITLYMDIADRVSRMSVARRLMVGSVIVKNNSILSYGWNGMPSGWDNDCENVEWCSAGGWLSAEEIIEGWPYEGTYLDAWGIEMQGRYRLKTKPEVLHSESNALAKVAKSTESSDGATMFCTHAPCMQCAKLIYQSGIKSLYYRTQYRDTAGIEFLTRSNVDVHQHGI